MPRGKGIEALFIIFRMFIAGEADGAAGRCSRSCWSSNFKGIGSSYIDFTFPTQLLAPAEVINVFLVKGASTRVI